MIVVAEGTLGNATLANWGVCYATLLLTSWLASLLGRRCARRTGRLARLGRKGA